MGSPLWVTIAALIASAPGCFGDTQLGAFPRKPIKVVVPFTFGGGSDNFARIIQKAVRDDSLLPQPLVIINVPGAGGTVGSRRVRDAGADGHTILCLHEGILSSKYAGRATYGPEAFRPIAATGKSNLVICVREDSKFKDLAELMSAAKERPDTILFGMAQGTPTHFAGRRLEAASDGARFRFVASGGGSKRFNDLVGGHIDATPFSLAEHANFKPSGVRAIAYLDAERLASLPDLPTAREQGFDVTMTHVQYWWAPRSTPDDAIRKIADVLEKALATRYVGEKLHELKIEPFFMRAGELEEHLKLREAEFQDVALVDYEGLPDPVPAVVAIVLLLGALSILRSARRERPPLRGRLLLATAGTLAVYVLAMQLAGLPFAFATMAFVPLMGIATGVRTIGTFTRLAIAGAVLGWACFFIFTKVLVIDLP